MIRKLAKVALGLSCALFIASAPGCIAIHGKCCQPCCKKKCEKGCQKPCCKKAEEKPAEQK